MAGKSPVTADEEQRSALIALSRSRDRGEADRARAILLTLSGWTSGQIAQAFGVREDTVRFWRGDFLRGRRRPPVPLLPARGGFWMFIASPQARFEAVPARTQSPGRYGLIEVFYQY